VEGRSAIPAASHETVRGCGGFSIGVAAKRKRYAIIGGALQGRKGRENQNRGSMGEKDTHICIEIR
jgi:hypothetical protein